MAAKLLIGAAALALVGVAGQAQACACHHVVRHVVYRYVRAPAPCHCGRTRHVRHVYAAPAPEAVERVSETDIDRWSSHENHWTDGQGGYYGYSIYQSAHLSATDADGYLTWPGKDALGGGDDCNCAPDQGPPLAGPPPQAQGYGYGGYAGGAEGYAQGGDYPQGGYVQGGYGPNGYAYGYAAPYGYDYNAYGYAPNGGYRGYAYPPQGYGRGYPPRDGQRDGYRDGQYGTGQGYRPAPNGAPNGYYRYNGPAQGSQDRYSGAPPRPPQVYGAAPDGRPYGDGQGAPPARP